MTKRHEVEEHIEVLNEIQNIMGGMKNLAIMEMHKLARYHKTQQQAVDSIAHALNDVRRHYASDQPPDHNEATIYLLLGSERGFCGPYNEQILERLGAQPDHQHAPIIAVGSRLSAPALRQYPNAVCLPGPVVADEVETVLSAIMEALNQLRQARGAFRLEVIYFAPSSHEPQCLPALPPLESVAHEGFPPIINLPPARLLSELLEHYLFAVTHAWLFTALTAENQRRMQHLEQATHHLEKVVDDLDRRRNVLRQEEIIEEIEVILLSSEAVGAPGV